MTDKLFFSVTLMCVLIRYEEYEEKKERFIRSLPELDFPFYMATGVSCLSVFVKFNFTYHFAIQNIRKYLD